MGRERTLKISESIFELKKLQKKQPNIKAEKRVLCLILLKTDKFATQQLLADHLGVCRQQLVAWLTQYRKFGMDGFLLKTSRNKKSKIITPEIHQGLSEKVRDSENPLFGYKDAQRWVLENFETEVSYNALRDYLKKHFKTKAKKP